MTDSDQKVVTGERELVLTRAFDSARPSRDRGAALPQ